MTARSANGSCTPTEFSSGGSANATGVIATLVMRMLPLAIALVPAVGAVDQAEQPVRVGLADRVRQQRAGPVLIAPGPQERVHRQRADGRRAAVGGGGERAAVHHRGHDLDPRSEEHTSELQSPTNLVC